jgi:hypothetical protein
MNDDKVQKPPPPIAPPDNPHNLSLIGTGLPPINWRPALFFLLGIVGLFLFLGFANKVAVADGAKPDAPVVQGTEVFFVGLIFLYFAISAMGMALAKRKATLIKFALAAHLALFTAFVLMFVHMWHTDLAAYGKKPGYSLNTVIGLCVGSAQLYLTLLSPWHIVWLFKLLAKEKHTT